MADLLELSRNLDPEQSVRGVPLGSGVAGRNLAVIEEMRSRGFTWREICKFLSDHGEYDGRPDGLRTCYVAYKKAAGRRG